MIITLRENVSKVSDRKRKKIIRLVIWTTDEQNVRLGKVLDVDLKITSLKIFQSHQKIKRSGKIKYVY